MYKIKRNVRKPISTRRIMKLLDKHRDKTASICNPDLMPITYTLVLNRLERCAKQIREQKDEMTRRICSAKLEGILNCIKTVFETDAGEMTRYLMAVKFAGLVVPLTELERMCGLKTDPRLAEIIGEIASGYEKNIELFAKHEHLPLPPSEVTKHNALVRLIRRLLTPQF